MDDNLTNGGELSSAEDGSENGIVPVTADLNGDFIGINNAGNVRPISIEDEMRSSYLDYAMSVIVARALARCARRSEAGPSPHSLRHA